MKYIQFEIEGYRAIEKGVVAVSNNLIPVIGINESGKTTILQAILAFDKNKDRYNNGEHLLHKNKYVIEEKDGKVSADVLIEGDEDLEFFSSRLNLSAVDVLYKTLQEFAKSLKPITLSRSFPSKRYSIANDELTSIIGKNKQRDLAEAVYERLPFILYFDDFSDRVPASIEFQINKELSKGYAPAKGNGEEWHSILEEVFRRASDDGKLSLTSFLKMRDPDSQEGLMNDIQDILHKEVVEDWINLKKRYAPDFGEESEELRLQLNWKISDDKKFITFTFQVQDRTTSKGRQFNITQRSKGFQWFFNFIMKLKFNPKYQTAQKGAIYLLDEPGSYLHNSAQEELLKKLQDISNTNTILYCTHSQYLLDPETINISRIKIAKKKAGKIQILSYDTAGVSKNEGALTPLNQALHIKSGFYNKDVKYPVITEGITDFYLFNLIKKYKEGYFNDKIDFIPGAGADHLKDLISHAIAFSDNYLILLDSDDKGMKAYEKYGEFFGSEEKKKMFVYTLPGKKKEVVLEDFLSVADKKHLKDLTNIEDTKAALPLLYYTDEKSKKAFVENLSDVTLKNLAIIQGKINSIVNK